jgi:hypothetical protein
VDDLVHYFLIPKILETKELTGSYSDELQNPARDITIPGSKLYAHLQLAQFLHDVGPK